MWYRGVYYFSAEVLRPEVSMSAPKDAEVVMITEAGLLKSHERRLVLTTVRTAAVRRGSLATITTPHQIFSNFRSN